MMTSENTSLEFARESCIAAHAEVRRLQMEAGFAPEKCCKMPLAFTAMRVKALDALTETFERIAEGIEVELHEAAVRTATFVAEQKAEPVAAPEITFGTELELLAARKRCERALENLRFQQRKAGHAVAPVRSFKGLDLRALIATENDLQNAVFPYRSAAADKRAAIAAAEAEAKAEAKAKADAEIAEARHRQAEAARAHVALETAYAAELKELGDLDRDAAAACYHPRPARISLANLKALVERVEAAIVAVIQAQHAKAAEAEARRQAIEAERKRSLLKSQHARDQELRSKYLQLQRSGRAHQPFGVWVRSQRAA